MAVPSSAALRVTPPSRTHTCSAASAALIRLRTSRSSSRRTRSFASGEMVSQGLVSRSTSSNRIERQICGATRAERENSIVSQLVSLNNVGPLEQEASCAQALIGPA